MTHQYMECVDSELTLVRRRRLLGHSCLTGVSYHEDDGQEKWTTRKRLSFCTSLTAVYYVINTCFYWNRGPTMTEGVKIISEEVLVVVDEANQSFSTAVVMVISYA